MSDPCRREAEVISAVEDFLDFCVKPKANAIDQDVGELRAALDAFADAGYLGLRVPGEFGGLGLSDGAFRRIQEAVARRSGAFAFLQTQHQSACNFVATSENVGLRERLLPRMATGDLRMGIAFAQLRRPGSPMMTATPDEHGWRFDGTAPWVTGWGLFTHCVYAATLPDGRSVWTVGELRDGSGMKPSPVMRLASLEVAQTVSLEMSGVYFSESDAIHIRPPNWIHDNDTVNVALQSPFALGCAQAAIDVMREAAIKKPIPAMPAAADTLEGELAACRSECYSSMDERGDLERSLRSRAWAIELMGRCAHGAVVCASGSGNSMSHSAQRVYREALVFSVSAQTQAILEATLARLGSRG